MPNMLGDHFHPILVLLAPLYWLAPRPETLLIAQAALMAASIVPVYFYARLRLGPGAGLAIAAAYGLFWGIQKAIAFDFHEVAFAPLLVATLILAMETRRWPLFWVAAAALLLVKEDMALLVAAAGVVLLLRGERRRGALALVIGAATFAGLVLVVLPAVAGTASHGYASIYPGAGEALRHPGAVLARLVTPGAKLHTLLLWFGPFLFLSLASPLILLGVPVLLSLLLSSNPNHWVAHFHYSAPLAPVLAMAACDAIARLGLSGRLLWRRAAIVAMLALCAVLPGKLPVWRLLSPAFYRFSESEQAGHRMLAMVPSGASVVAQAAIAPHLSRRPVIHVLSPEAPEADFVVASESLSPWPNGSPAEVAALLRERVERGYSVAASERGWVLLRRLPAGSVSLTPRNPCWYACRL
jgi:uncharacterized membrane protein